MQLLSFLGRLVCLAVLTCLVAGCEPGNTAQTGSSADSGPGRIKVVCTTGQVGDLVTQIGGEHVAVHTLMGPGVDPHLYRGTLADTQRLEMADVVFYNGLHLEGRLADALENLSRRKPAYAVTEDLLKEDAKSLRTPSEFEGNYDPHVWFDASLWSRCAETVTLRLAELDPSHAADYRKHLADYQARLDELHARCKAEIASIPPEQRLMVTAHDAFGYFGRAYDIEVHGLQGISTADEADLNTIRQLVDLLASRKVKAVFVESSVPPRNLQSLVEGCTARGHTVVLGGELYSDALGPADSDASTYLGMMEHNLRTIVQSLK